MKFIKTALCLSLSMAITACSEQVSVESRLTTAKSYLSENKVNESIIALKNAIRADAKNAEARFLLGQIYLNLGDGASATKELERANQFGYDANKVLPLLARAYILTKSDADVLALSEMAQMLSPAEYSHYLAYKTLAELRSEKRLSAKDSVVLAKSIDGENKYSLLALAYLRLAEQRYDEVRLLLLQILILDDKQVDALLLQGQLSMITKEYAQAAQSFKVFLELQPRVGVVKLLLAEALLKSERFDEAEKYADDILAKVKSQPFAHYIKAMVAFYNENYEQSSEHAEFSISGGFNQYNLRLVAGASAFYLKNWELSYKHLSSVVKYLPKEHLGRRMLAVTQLELGLINEISSTVSDFRNVSGDAQFVSSLSYKLLELGAIDEAKKLLEQNDVTSP
ncbi:MAG: XrtA/PEP-CTERM system TPR-repeat protein PrsT, partial [Colwellia sp.]